MRPLSEGPTGTARLVIRRGPQAGAAFVLTDGMTTIGRADHVDIVLDNMTVADRHALIHRDIDLFNLHDLGSLNGTYLNGRLVDHAVLTDGDDIRIGTFRLAFHIG